MPRVDIQTADHGSIWTFTPLTARARSWIRIHLHGETVCEHRYGYDIAIGMLDAGLILQDARTGRLARRGGES